jgi:hypothetical protein
VKPTAVVLPKEKVAARTISKPLVTPVNKPMTKVDILKFERDMERITQSIYKGWLKEDMPIIKKMHPKALAVVPLYRSAMVVEQNAAEAKNGQVRLIVYHDPGWMGGTTTRKSLKVHSWQILLHGTRSGPTVYVYENKYDHCSSFLRSIVGPLLEKNGVER